MVTVRSVVELEVTVDYSLYERAALLQGLALDARPGYQDDPARRYGFSYAGFDVRFTVAEGRLTVVEVVRL